MKNKLLLCALVLTVVAAACQSCTSAQGPGAGHITASKEVVFQVELKGKIGYLKDLGGYYLYGAPEEYRIANQSPEVLGELAKSKRVVVVKGAVSQNTGYLTIAEIDGKPYKGSRQPYSGM